MTTSVDWAFSCWFVFLLTITVIHCKVAGPPGYAYEDRWDQLRIMDLRRSTEPSAAPTAAMPAMIYGTQSVQENFHSQQYWFRVSADQPAAISYVP